MGAGGFKKLESKIEIQMELLKNGPVTAGMELTEDFLGSNQAAFNTTNEDVSHLGWHALNIIGWSQEPNGGYSWIVKNSWGTKTNNIRIGFGVQGIDSRV